jgi:hypothetical protein
MTIYDHTLIIICLRPNVGMIIATCARMGVYINIFIYCHIKLNLFS